LPSSTDRKRLEITASLYAELERHARSLHVSTTALATMLLADAMQAAEARAHVPFRARREPTSDQATCDHTWVETNEGKGLVCPKCGMGLVRAE